MSDRYSCRKTGEHRYAYGDGWGGEACIDCMVPAPERQLPAAFWRWRCPDGHGGAHNNPSEADQAAEQHMASCAARPVSMHTAATPKPWTGQAKLGAF